MDNKQPIIIKRGTFVCTMKAQKLQAIFNAFTTK